MRGTHLKWMCTVVASSLALLGSISPASAQFEGLKDKVKKKADDAAKDAEKEIDKALKGKEKDKDKSGAAPKDAPPSTPPSTPPAAPATPGAPAPASALATNAAPLTVAPTRLVPLGNLPEDIQVENIVFAPGLERAAWIGRKGSRQAVFVNGQAGPGCDEVVAPPRFSPDGSRVAYVIRRGDHQHLVVDAVESAAFMHIDPNSIKFSADGSHCAAEAYRQASDGNSQAFIILDGQEQGPFDGLLGVRLVAGELAYTKSVRDEHGYARYIFVHAGNEYPVRSSQYTWDSGLPEAEATLRQPMTTLAVGDEDEQLMVGQAVGPIVRHIRAIQASPDGSAWSYIAALPPEPGEQPHTHVVVVNGEIVHRFDTTTERAHDEVRVVFAESGPRFALIDRSNHRGIRAIHNGKADPEYHEIDLLRLTADGELSYWAQKDGYIYRVVNGEESEGIRGSAELTDSLHAIAVVRDRHPSLVINEATKIKVDGREYEHQLPRLALGSNLGPRAERIQSFAASADGKTLALLAGGVEGKEEGYWAICGPAECRVSTTSVNGVEGEWRVDDTGANSILIVTARGRHEFPPDRAGNTPTRRFAQGDAAYAQSLHLLRNGLWQGDLYLGREMSRRTRVAGIAITPDLAHTIHWLGSIEADASNFDPKTTWTLVFDGRPIDAPQPMNESPQVVSAVNPVYPYQPFQAQALAAGSLWNNGTLYRYITRDGDALTLVEFDLAALESASQ